MSDREPIAADRRAYTATIVVRRGLDGLPEATCDVHFDPSVSAAEATAYAAEIPNTLRRLAAELDRR